MVIQAAFSILIIAALPTATLAQSPAVAYTSRVVYVLAPDQANFITGLTMGPGGYLYGTARDGGSSGSGALFRITKDGSYYELLHRFSPLPKSGKNVDGAHPVASLVFDNAGNAYGTTAQGGPGGGGVVFTMRHDGGGYRVLHTFAVCEVTDVNKDGCDPEERLVATSAGTLYGTAERGGPNAYGTLFSLRVDGSRFTLLHAFGDDDHTGASGGWPVGGLVASATGDLFGILSTGGKHALGALFRYWPGSGALRNVHDFSSADSGSVSDPLESPTALATGFDGSIYGACLHGGVVGAGTLFRISADGGGFKTIHQFGRETNGSGEGGACPASLMAGQAGALFGRTLTGGENGVGTVFRVGLDGSDYTPLISFGVETGDLLRGDGVAMRYALVQSADGSVYTTSVLANGRGSLILRIYPAPPPPKVLDL